MHDTLGHLLFDLPRLRECQVWNFLGLLTPNWLEWRDVLEKSRWVRAFVARLLLRPRCRTLLLSRRLPHRLRPNRALLCKLHSLGIIASPLRVIGSWNSPLCDLMTLHVCSSAPLACFLSSPSVAAFAEWVDTVRKTVKMDHNQSECGEVLPCFSETTPFHLELLALVKKL